MSADLSVILFEGDGAAPLAGDLRFDLARRCLDAGLRVLRATCLCEISIPQGRRALLLGCLGEAFKANAAALESEILAIRDVQGLSAQQCWEIIEEHRNQQPAPAGSNWVPWFPLIDAEKCTRCAKCLSFCLFGVFRREPDGAVHVANPAKCKTNCPACARVCPSGAIVFAKYAEAPVNGGQAETPVEPVQVDLDDLAKRDVYAALRSRSASAGPSEQACDCLQRLSKQLDIPQDVLANLRGGDGGQDVSR